MKIYYAIYVTTSATLGAFAEDFGTRKNKLFRLFCSNRWCKDHQKQCSKQGKTILCNSSYSNLCCRGLLRIKHNFPYSSSKGKYGTEYREKYQANKGFSRHPLGRPECAKDTFTKGAFHQAETWPLTINPTCGPIL